MQQNNIPTPKKSNRGRLLTTAAVLIVVLCTVGVTMLFALRGRINQPVDAPTATATEQQPVATDTPLPKPTNTNTLTVAVVENTATSTPTEKPDNTSTAIPVDTDTPAPTDTPVVLVVTATFTPPSSVVTCSPPSGWITYIVQPGDTLYNISVRTSTTVNQLKVANCLSSTLIYVGQRLYVPFYPVSTNTPIPPTLTPTGVITTTPTTIPTLPIVLPTNTPIPPTAISPVATPTNTPIPPTPTATIPPTAVSPLPTPTP